MKNLFKSFLIVAALIVSGTAFGQTTLNIDNASSCDYELLLIFSNSSNPCGPATSRLNTNVTQGSNSYTVPAGMVVRRAKFIGCCGGSTGTSVISYYCSPTITVGDIDCSGNPVTLNFVQDDLIEISN